MYIITTDLIVNDSGDRYWDRYLDRYWDRYWDRCLPFARVVLKNISFILGACERSRAHGSVKHEQISHTRKWPTRAHGSAWFTQVLTQKYTQIDTVVILA